MQIESASEGSCIQHLWLVEVLTATWPFGEIHLPKVVNTPNLQSLASISNPMGLSLLYF
jgi:hypothetical protein